MTCTNQHDLTLLRQIYGNSFTLKQLLRSEDGQFGPPYQFVLSPKFDLFLSQHVIAFTNQDAWNDRNLRPYVKDKASLTLNALYFQLKKHNKCSAFMAKHSRDYFTANGEHFQRLFSLLQPCRRSLFCFICINPLYLSLGDSTFLQVAGPFTLEERQIKNSHLTAPPSVGSLIKASEILIKRNMVKKCCFSHRQPKSCENIPTNRMLYDHSIKRMHLFIHQYDFVDSIMPSIFGVIIPEKARIGEYREAFESIKLNHMIFEFEKTLDLVAGKEMVTQNTSLQSLVSSYVPHDQVCEFMRRVFFATFPRRLFGSNQNRQKFYRGLKLIITSSRISKIRSSNVSRGLNFKVIPWLHSDKRHPSQGQFLKFTEFVILYILHLLRSFFYVTETQFSKQQNVFYRKKSWRRIYKLALENMATEQGKWCTLSSSSVDAAAASQSLSLMNHPWKKSLSKGQGRIVNRVIPKKSSVRIIEPNRCANWDQLCAMKAIIRCMRKFQTSRQSNEHFSRLIHWCGSMALAGQLIYFIRSDIQDCYPSVDHHLLMSIVRQHMLTLFSQEQPEFIDVLVLDVIRVVSCRIFSSQIYIPLLEKSERFFERLKMNLGPVKNKLIIPRRIVRLSSPYDCIRRQVVDNFIPVDSDKCFKLIKGLRQGDPISSDLTSLYIQHYLDEMTGDLVSGATNHCKLMFTHSADDMIFACIDEEDALTLLSRITYFPNRFHLSVNFKKVQINFSQAICDQIAPSEMINYNGFKINSSHFAIHADYSYLKNSDIRYSFDSNQFRALREIVTHLKRQVSTISPLLLHPSLNSVENIAVNLYEKIYFQAIRLAYHLLASPIYRVKQVPSQLLCFVLSVVRIVSKRSALLPERNLPLSHLQVTCITLSALLHLWCNNSHLYSRKQERTYILTHSNHLVKHDAQLAIFLDMTPPEDLRSIIFTRSS